MAGLNAHADLEYSTIAYALPTPVLGGEAVLSMSSIVANTNTSIFGTLTGPGGGTISGSRGQSDDRVWRPLSDRATALEPGREQLHDLPDRRHSGRPIQFK